MCSASFVYRKDEIKSSAAEVIQRWQSDGHVMVAAVADLKYNRCHQMISGVFNCTQMSGSCLAPILWWATLSVPSLRSC